jgi:hypothetical protein
MIQLEDIVEIHGKQYRCWFREDLSGDNFNNFRYNLDKIYIHFINVVDDNDCICLVGSELFVAKSYIDELMRRTSAKTFDSNSI